METIVTRIEVQGEDHPGTQATRRAYAQALLEIQQRDKAVEVLAPLSKEANPDQPAVTARLMLLAAWIADLDRRGLPRQGGRSAQADLRRPLRASRRGALPGNARA